MKISQANIVIMDNIKSKSKEKCFSPNKKVRTISAPNSPFLTHSTPISVPDSYKRLEDARIIQRTLVYIINLPSSVSDEETLLSPLFFGKFGKILKIHISQGHHSSSDSTYGAYLTFSTEEEAAVCIRACKEFLLDGKKLTVTYGTTKYCSYFLKNSRCPKSECVFLHHMASTADTIFREEMINNKHIQPEDSVFDRIKVIVTPPQPPSRLPEFRIIRDRSISEIISGNSAPATRTRVYSKDYTTSKFKFIMDGDAEIVEIPGVITKLREFASPCKDIAIIPTKDIEDLFDPSSPLKWASDFIDVTPDQDNFIVTKKETFSLS